MDITNPEAATKPKPQRARIIRVGRNVGLHMIFGVPLQKVAPNYYRITGIGDSYFTACADGSTFPAYYRFVDFAEEIITSKRKGSTAQNPEYLRIKPGRRPAYADAIEEYNRDRDEKRFYETLAAIRRD